MKKKDKKATECKLCINNSDNPYVEFNSQGYCITCERYMKAYDKKKLKKELDFIKSFIGKGKGNYDIMVGLSGGKDSTATLYLIKDMGFTPLAYTFDTGYFHPYIYRRAKSVAKRLGADYEVIPVRKYLTKEIKSGFKRMYDLYSSGNKKDFVNDYVKGREGYSGVVRPCWVCRKLIIRARYFEALKHGVQLVATGINEWTSLKQTTNKKEFEVSAVRKLKPHKNKPAVYIIHYPFLMGMKLSETKKILKKGGVELL